MVKTGGEAKDFLYYVKATSIVLGVLITVTSIYAGAFKFIYDDKEQINNIDDLQSFYVEFQKTVIDSISSSNESIRELRIELQESNKDRADEFKLINQKITAIIESVPNNKELIRKIDDIHYFYQEWHDAEKKNNEWNSPLKQGASTQ